MLEEKAFKVGRIPLTLISSVRKLLCRSQYFSLFLRANISLDTTPEATENDLYIQALCTCPSQLANRVNVL